MRDDVAAGRRRLHISSLSVREATTPPAWIMQPPPDWQTPLNGLFHPQREADHYANNWWNPEVLNERNESCPYRWATHAIIVSTAQCAPASINA